LFTPVPLSPSSIIWYRSKGGDTLRLGSKGRYGSFRLRMNAGCAGKTVRSLDNACHTWAP